MLPCAVVFSTPRKLPKVGQLRGRVVVLDIAFAGLGSRGGFEKVTLPFIEQLGDRLAAWVDHHDHEAHARFMGDSRFILATKAEHPACPEMITRELTERVGPVDTIVCHTDFDGLASAAKWIRKGSEPYPGCDADARAIDTRLGTPSETAHRMDRALRARPRDAGLFGIIVRHLAEGLTDPALWEPIDSAAQELEPIERETRRVARDYVRIEPGLAFVDVASGHRRLDKTLLHLIGQEREPVSVVMDRDNISVAARFDSGHNFVELFGTGGGMPTRVSVPRKRARQVLEALGVDPRTAEELAE